MQFRQAGEQRSRRLGADLGAVTSMPSCNFLASPDSDAEVQLVDKAASINTLGRATQWQRGISLPTWAQSWPTQSLNAAMPSLPGRLHRNVREANVAAKAKDTLVSGSAATVPSCPARNSKILTHGRENAVAEALMPGAVSMSTTKALKQ